MTQTRQDVHSTKPKPIPSTPAGEVAQISSDIPATKSNELFIIVKPVSKLYTNDMGRFPIRSRSGHRYIILVLHCDSNAILVETFQSRHDQHHIVSYRHIMTRLRERGYVVDLKVLYNIASK